MRVRVEQVERWFRYAASSTATDKPPKVAVVLYGPANDGGWNTTWTAAVDKLKAAVPGVEVTVVPNVNPAAQAQKTLSTLGQQGYGLVVVTGGYTTADFKKATAAYPNTQFVNLFGTDVGSNLSRFDIGLEDSRYLDGMLAAMSTKSNIIGEVGGTRYPSRFAPWTPWHWAHRASTRTSRSRSFGSTRSTTRPRNARPPRRWSTRVPTCS